MRAYVFKDAALAPVAARFVWLSINTEKEGNHAFLDHFPIESWPTLLVIDPRTEQPFRKWLGSATVAELDARLDEAAKTFARRNADPATARAEAALARAGERSNRGDRDGAIAAYREALKDAPRQWAQRPQAVEGLIFALQGRGEDRDCAALALEELDALPKGTTKANVAESGLMCAQALPSDDPLAQKARGLEDRVEALAEDQSLSLLADDRSGLWDTLVSAREQRGDTEGAREAAKKWARFLEAEAARAKTPQARAVFDSHRLSAYLVLGEPERAVPMLEQTERALPDDYNAPARLAVAYLAMHAPKKALDASQRAEKKVYGPRSISVLVNEAKAQVALGDAPAAAATLDRAEALARGFTDAQGGRRLLGYLQRVRQKLLGAPRG
jgi:tetratricopeptide (TPR) repeat protein